MAFVGRELELDSLERLYTSREAKLIVLHGRRRVGKSALIERFVKNKHHLQFEQIARAISPLQGGVKRAHFLILPSIA